MSKIHNIFLHISFSLPSSFMSLLFLHFFYHSLNVFTWLNTQSVPGTTRHWKCVCVLLVRWTRIWEASVLSLKCLEHWRRDQKIQSWDKDRIEQQYERSTHISLTESPAGPWVAGKRSQPQLWESEYDWQVTSLTWKSHLHHYPSPRRQHFGTWCECELKVNDE